MPDRDATWPVVPAELRGRWTTTLPNGDKATLTIRPAHWQIVRGASAGSGALEVRGDLLVFTTSTSGRAGQRHVHAPEPANDDDVGDTVMLGAPGR